MKLLVVPMSVQNLKVADEIYSKITAAMYNDDRITVDFSNTVEVNEDIVSLLFMMIKRTWGLQRMSRQIKIIFGKPKYRLKSIIVNALKSENDDV